MKIHSCVVYLACAYKEVYSLFVLMNHFKVWGEREKQ